MHNAVMIQNEAYLPLSVIAKAFCLCEDFVTNLTMAKTKDKARYTASGELLISYNTFKRLRLPQDNFFFKILGMFLTKIIKQRSNRNGNNVKR